MAIDPNIALGVRPIEIANPLAQYGQVAQLQAAQQAQQMNALKMQEAQATMEERNALRRLDPTAADYESQLFRVNPQLGINYRKEAATTAAQKAAETKSLTETAGLKQKMLSQALRDISDRPSDANITAHTEDIQTSSLFSQEEKAKALITQQTLLAIPFEQRQSYLSQQGATASDLKPTVQSVNQYGQTQLLRVPAFGGAPTSVGTYADVPLPADVQAQKLQSARAGATNVNVSTEKKYGEAFGTKIADVDIGKMTTAEKAPQMAENANRIIDLVKQGNVFTGPAADVKLNIARVLNVAGASNDEKIANTESLIAGTGQSTLDAIKGAGLGTGQGFTDKDLRFLQGIAGGTIGLTAKTLTDLAELQHRVAVRSAEAWNKRSGEMPKEVIQGTGLNTTPIKVPPLSSGAAKAVARPAGVGANWTFERDNAGNTAWVSPDRKSFKEAQ